MQRGATRRSFVQNAGRRAALGGDRRRIGASAEAAATIDRRLIKEARARPAATRKRLGADGFHLARAARHPLSGQHLDRRAAAAGAVRHSRRRLRLRHVLRVRARRRAGARLRRIRNRAAHHPLRARQGRSGPSAITISPSGAGAPSRTEFARRWRCPMPSPSTRPCSGATRAGGRCRSMAFRRQIVAGEQRHRWRTATSSASCRGGRTSISSIPAW